MPETFAFDSNDLPPLAAYRFRGGDLRFPSAQADADALEGIDPAYASAAMGEPHISVPTADGKACLWLYSDAEGDPLPEGWKEMPARAALQAAIAADSTASTMNCFRAFHVLQWRAESRFCGRCGAPNSDATDELARLCPSCGRREYPRISPAVIVLVTREDGRALLAHNAKFRQGLYSLVAGFVEAGESLEDAVVREVEEEVGVQVDAISYRASQAWPFPNSLMLAFFARWAGGEIRPDGVEIEDARWFDPDSLPDIPGPGSVSRLMIDAWIKAARPEEARPEED